MARIKSFLDRRGLYVRRTKNLPLGIDWVRDARRLMPAAEHQVLFDVGANRGEATERLHDAFPGATIHAFEPVPATFEMLCAAVGDQSDVHVHCLAMTSTTGRRPVCVVDGAYVNSLAGERLADDAESRFVDFECTTIDDFCARNRIARVDVLKTDTEGFDADVLKGAEGMLGAGAIGAVCCEISFNPDDPEVSNFQKIRSLLARYGFAPVTMYVQEAFRYGVLGKYGDALFLKVDALPGWARRQACPAEH